MNIESIIKRIKVHYNSNEFAESVALCQKILAKKKNNHEALYLLGLSVQAQKKHALAIDYFLQYINKHGGNGHAYNALAQTYVLLTDYDNAEKYCLLALKLMPEYGAAYNNLAICKQRTHQFKEAEQYYKQAILHKGDDIFFRINLGKLYKESGDFEQSNKTLVKAMEFNGDKSTIYTTMYENFMYMHQYQDALEIADLGLINNEVTDIYSIELLIGKAILFWLFDNVDEAIQALNLSEGIYAIPDDTHENVADFKIFHTYLKKLIVFYQQNHTLYNERQSDVYFISESHGFAANNMQIDDGEGVSSIRPIFIKGAKIFHLIQENTNQFKTSLLAAFNGLPSNSQVIVGFGEIDCRFNEGILPYCLSNNVDHQSVIASMVIKYIDLLKTEGTSRLLNIVVYGVPSPHPEQLALLAEPQQEQLKAIIYCFNELLKKECEKNNLLFLDVYALTNVNGVSNLTYHLDNIHLTPSVLPILLKQLNG